MQERRSSFSWPSTWVVLVLAAAAPSCGSGTVLEGDADGGGESVPVIPPIDAADAADAVGWRDSTEPWLPPDDRECDNAVGWLSADLRTEAEGVYLLVRWVSGLHDPAPNSLSVQLNDGSGWREILHADCGVEGTACPARLAGSLDGRLVGWSPESIESEGRARGRFTCLDSPPRVCWPDVSGLYQVFVVSPDTAYAFRHEELGPEVIELLDGTWSVLPPLLPTHEFNAMWADAEGNVLLATEDGLVVARSGDEWTTMDVGSLDPLSAIWSFGPDDIWVGTAAGGIRHFDGESWQELAWPSLATGGVDPGEDPCDNLGAVGGFWGADGVLFFFTANQIVKWQDGTFEVLGHWPGTRSDEGLYGRCIGAMRPVAMWGKSPEEVFIVAVEPTVRDSDWRERDDCYEHAMWTLWWDGEHLRWF